jgi:hypothetical protein
MSKSIMSPEFIEYLRGVDREITAQQPGGWAKIAAQIADKQQ